jgi:anti-sigma factor RsiW
MTAPEPTTDELVSYLLGELPAERAEALETDFFAGDELFEALEATEAELYADYASGMLSQRRRALFEARYLTNSDARQRLRFAAALERSARAEASPAPMRPERAGWLQRLLRPRALVPAVAAFACLLLFVVLRDAPAELPQVVRLDGHAVRGDHSVTALPKAEEVVLELVGHEDPIHVRLLRGERVVAQPQVRFKEGVHRVVLRPRELKPGIYELELSRGAGSEREILAYHSLQIE